MERTTIEAIRNTDYADMHTLTYCNLDGAEYVHVVEAEITAAEEAFKASFKETVITKGAVAARRRATAMAEKAYKEAKAEHVHKSALMGTRRYNGEYTPYTRGAKIIAHSVIIEDDYEENIFEAEDKLTKFYKLVEEKAKVQKELDSIESAIECAEAEIRYMKKNYDRIVNPTKWGDDYIIEEIFEGYVASKKPFIEEQKEEATKVREKLYALEEAIFYF